MGTLLLNDGDYMKKNRKKMKRAKGRKVSKQWSAYYNLGYNRGFNHGFDIGYNSGWDQAMQGEIFNGTSIIIPTRNQLELLKQCIESILAYTDEPYEIIVIDNASTDGTADYLKTIQSRNVRYRIFENNLGFAGGTNQGLKIARGKYLLLLNNDTVVTKNWLKNLLHCLDSNDNYGFVGPLTNYISGDQQIDTDYETIADMHHFAEQFNHSDPLKWKTTGRLPAFCLLMKRTLFERLGYLDEAFEIGNCEDDDYNFRAKLLGQKLVIAGDTFIHHVGSVSVKALGEEKFTEVYSNNLDYYEAKWGDTHAFLQEVDRLRDGSFSKINDFFPSHVLVKGAGNRIYWIDNRVRRPVIDPDRIHANIVRLSQIDILNWSLGDPIYSHEVITYLNDFQTGNNPFQDGHLIRCGKQVYQIKEHCLHRLCSDTAMRLWGLEGRHPYEITKERWNDFKLGLPIIPPITIKNDHI